jgi:hypothetical protein
MYNGNTSYIIIIGRDTLIVINKVIKFVKFIKQYVFVSRCVIFI